MINNYGSYIGEILIVFLTDCGERFQTKIKRLSHDVYCGMDRKQLSSLFV